MEDLTEQQKRKIRRHLAVNDIAVREELNLLDDKIEETSCEMCDKIDSISEQLHEKIEEAIEIATETQKMEGASGYTPIKGIDYNDGEDYILTDQDKKEIASLITIPTVEKVIEKTEIIKEQPIITEITKEIKIESPFELKGDDIVEKINELSTDDDEYKIDASHIKNLPKNKVENRTTTILRREPSSTSSNTVTVINNTASVISAYHAVYVNTANTTLPSVAYSQANALATSRVLGITIGAIPVGQQGTVITFGVLSGFNTSTFTAGDKLYLSTTDVGDLVNTPATTPNFNTFVGWALDSQINGSIFIKPEEPLAVEVYLGGLSSPSDLIAPSQKAVKTYVDTAAPVRYQYNGEALSGTKDGVNTIFRSLVAPILPIVTRNGQVLVYGIDYTLVGNTFTLVIPPLPTTELYISYESYTSPL